MANLSNINNKFLVTTGGDVGIGVTSPGEKLDVDGNIRVRGVSATKQGVIHNSGSYFSLVSTGDTSDTTGARIWLGNNSSANAYYQNASTHYFRDLSSSIKMTLLSSGNLGIGRTPDVKILDLQSTSGLALRFYNSATFKAGIEVVTTAGQMIGSSAVNDLAIRSQSDMLFSTGGNTERMRIDSSGNVGIGETDPSGYWGQANNIVIDTSGNGGITIKSTSAGNGRLVFTDTKSATAGNTDGGMIAYNHTDDEMRFQTNGGQRIVIDSSGNVGIGNPNPLAKLQITSGDSGSSSPWSNADELVLESSGNAGLAFQTPNTGAATIAFQDPESVQAGFIQYLHADNALRFATNGNNERMRIDSSGAITTDVTGEITIPFYIDGYRTGVQQIWLNNSRAANSSNGRGTKLILGAGNTIGAYFTHYTAGSTGNAVLDIGVQYTGVTTQSGLEFNTNSNRTVLKSVGGSAAYTSFESSDGTERMRILNNGNISIPNGSIEMHPSGGQGIYLGSNNGSNRLDDYEEGTWTPAVQGSGTAGTVTYGSQGGSYTKIGNKVTCWFSITNFTQSGASGNFTITGLPFTCITTSAVRGCFSSNLRFYNMPFPGDLPVISLSDNNTSFIILWSRNNTTWIGQAVANTGNQYIEGYVTYSTA